MKQLPFHLTLILLFTLLAPTVSAEIPWPESNLWPESPQGTAIRQAMMPSPSLVTGAVEFDIPVHTVKVEGYELPVGLHYRSNGIKVSDSAEPVGYGWVLTPALRISREILGYPDEISSFKGDKDGSFFTDDYLNGYRTVHSEGLLDAAFHEELYDTRKDIFTVYLLDATLKMMYLDGTLKGAGCGEYRVVCGSLLNSITVTDPRGVSYRFDERGEYADHRGMTLEWLLTGITLPSGTSIGISWESFTPYYMTRSALEPARVQHDNSTYSEILMDLRVERFNTYGGMRRLKSISFPGGSLACSYAASGSLSMLNGIRISDSGGVARKTVTLTHDGALLSSVTIGGEGTWTMGYNAPNSFTPDNAATTNSMDWWGYYNGRSNNNLLSPSVGLILVNGMVTNVAGADRRCDPTKMGANLLRSVTLPTGGSVEWECEPHRFDAPAQQEWETGFISGAPVLSEGGGMRVRRITMRESAEDPSPRVRDYIYGEGGNGKGKAPSLPTLSTFIDETNFLSCYMIGTESIVKEDRHITVERFSNYMEGRNGELPVWYPVVVEREAEGQTEYRFSQLCGDNTVPRSRDRVESRRLLTALSSGPMLVSRTVSRSNGTGYEPVEKEELAYGIDTIAGHSSVAGWTVRRALLVFGQEKSPDFGLSDALELVPRTLHNIPYKGEKPTRMVFRNRYTWFHPSPSLTIPRTERLISRRLTEYTPNGSRTVTESFTHIKGTSLPESTVTSCGDESTTTRYIYGNGQSNGQFAAMSAANVRMPLDVRVTSGSATTGYTLQMARYGSVFRPSRIWQYRGSLWSTAEYGWDTKGNLTGKTGADGVSESWTYDVYGNPLTHTLGSDLTETATWLHLVGVTSLKTPAGVTESYTYDSYGRLSAVKLNNRPIRSIEYNITQSGSSYLRTLINDTRTTTSAVTARYDGLGREWGVFTELPDGQCLASVRGYDMMGRPSTSWSPATVSTSATMEEAMVAAQSLHSDTKPYSTTLYEASPREMVTGTIRAGEAAHSSGKKSTVGRYVNDGTVRSCLRYTAAADGVTQSGTWPAGSLIVESVTDESGHCVETYTDFRGHAVCRKDGGAATYFVYDSYGDLRYILPPGVSGTRKRTDTAMTDLAYWYDYDARGRMILKKLPGVKAAKMVYDPADRLVGESSAHHEAGQWRLYGYDSCGRQVVTADFTMTDAAAATYASECRTSVLQSGGAYAGYTMPDAPTGGRTVSASYYDGYDFITVNSLASAFNWTATGAAFSFANPGKISKGLLTGAYTGKGYESYYYNLDGQLMESYATGFNTVRTNYTYTYRGDPAKRWWTLPDGTVRTLQWQYDTSGRQTGMTVSYNGADGTVLEKILSYNGAGLLSREDFGKAYRLLTYDVAGRLSQCVVKSSGPPKPPKLSHEDLPANDGATTLALPPVRLWTVSDELLSYDAAGRISKKTISGSGYSYTYDTRGRLVKASAEGGKDFSAEYGYDDRNNLTTLKRNGAVDKSGTAYGYGTLDNLTYSYTGNMVTGVSASTEALPFEGMTGLGKTGTYTLSYDASGRLIKDSSRGIVNISYDNDGRVTNVKFSDMSEQQYEWDSNGNHVSTRFSGVSATGKPQDIYTRVYTGDGRVLEDGVEKYALFPGGYVQDGSYYWYSRDYQGNNITVLNQSGTPIQETDYYPYGEPCREPEGQPWLYSGNERLREDGINEYDFNARRYNSALGMFTTWDPLAEKRPWDSPYAFCAGDPVNHSDPTGLKIEGRTKEDINLLIDDLKAICSDEVFSEFTKLFVRDKKALSPISQESVEKAFEGISLNEDQKALVEIMVNTINSDDVHKVAYLNSKGKLPYSIAQKLIPQLNQELVDALLKGSGGIPIKVIFSERGHGATMTIPHGTYSLILKEAIAYAHNRAVITGHEIFGHGRSLALGRGDENQHVDAIQMENLILRIMHFEYVNTGRNHGKTGGDNSFSTHSKLPSYR